MKSSVEFSYDIFPTFPINTGPKPFYFWEFRRDTYIYFITIKLSGIYMGSNVWVDVYMYEGYFPKTKQDTWSIVSSLTNQNHLSDEDQDQWIQWMEDTFTIEIWTSPFFDSHIFPRFHHIIFNWGFIYPRSKWIR